MNIVMYFPKNFYLKEAINQKLQQLATAGLLEFYIQNFADDRFLTVKKPSSGPKKLQLAHLFGIFNIMLIGFAISLLIFLFEISISLIKMAFRLR